jgi:hypothetical protein
MNLTLGAGGFHNVCGNRLMKCPIVKKNKK